MCHFACVVIPIICVHPFLSMSYGVNPFWGNFWCVYLSIKIKQLSVAAVN